MRYEVKDSSGNKTVKYRKIFYKDIEGPKLTLDDSLTVMLVVGDEFKDSTYQVEDNCSSAKDIKVTISGKVDTSKAGEYERVYKAKDKYGNVTKVVQKISVMEPSKQGVIYLTFDDGPNANTTPKILDILQEKGIKATFFILNYDENEAQYVKREFDEGHTVAIHGYSHEYKIIYQSKDAYMENITKLQEKIKETTGQETTIIRFPGGSSNTISSFNPGIMTLLTNEVLVNGYRYFDWNVDSDDAGSARNSKDVYKNVIKGLSKERANVVLMHDFSGNNKTVEALPYIIEYGLENGYTFERITETTPMVTHRVFN